MSPYPAFIEGIGGLELLMVLFVVLLLFGANRLPELARGLGRSVREFRKATSGVEAEIRQVLTEPAAEEPKPPAPPPPGTASANPPPRDLP